MDRRNSWPWKKKPSEKTSEKKAVTSHSAIVSLDFARSHGCQKKMDYVQISTESYSHMAKLEDQVKALNDKVKTLTGNLSSAHSEMAIKDDLLNQHARVAEEAVSGWEKAEAEALALKRQLESVTLLKLSAEDRASHLDGSLKECMRQMQNLKDEHEQKLNEYSLLQSNESDKIKLELQTKINDLDLALQKLSDESAVLSRSLQERSDMLIKISEEKSQAMIEIELLKSNIQSCEREISSLNNELHIVSKELEIRDEETSMNMRSAEVANRQHIEGVKKVAKLEMECLRLSSLVRKQLPGQAALSQKKLEVENMGWDHGETRNRRAPHSAPLSDFCFSNIQQCPRDAQFLMECMSAMEEETKMLKEALTKRNNELKASRNLCAKTANKLQSLEAKMQMLTQQKSSEKSNSEILERSYTQMSSYPSSMASVSEDGIIEGQDFAGQSSAESKVSCISELSWLKDWKGNKASKAGEKIPLELMDDFLELERFASLSAESKGALSISESSTDKRSGNEDHKTIINAEKDGDLTAEKQSDLGQSEKCISTNEQLPVRKLVFDTDQVTLSELQSRISEIFESETEDADMGQILQDIKHLVQDIQESLSQHSLTCYLVETHSPDVTGNQKVSNITEPITSHAFSSAIFQIHDFVKSLGKEAIAYQDESFDGQGISHIIGEFSDCIDKVLCRKMNVLSFILELSHVLAKISELSISVLGYKRSERETNISDCIGKVTLLEHEVVQDDPLRKRVPNGCDHADHSASDLEVHGEGYLISSCYEFSDASWRGLLEELEQLKSEKAIMEIDLDRCTETLESTKLQLQQAEQLLSELKLQLASSQKSNSLTETQLKCMAESYKLLEKREQDLQAEVNVLRGKTLTLDNELQEEKQKHQGSLDKFKDLQEKIQRNEGCPVCCRASNHIAGFKSKQERDIMAATEKLAECQENIFLLDRQLKALRPPMELIRSPSSDRYQKNETLVPYNESEMEIITFPNNRKEDGESPSYMFNTSLSSSDAETDIILKSRNSPQSPKLRHSKSSSASMSRVLTSEKHGNGLSRFFFSKPRRGLA